MKNQPLTYDQLEDLKQNLRAIQREYGSLDDWRVFALAQAIRLVEKEKKRWWRKLISFVIDR